MYVKKSTIPLVVLLLARTLVPAAFAAESAASDDQGAPAEVTATTAANAANSKVKADAAAGQQSRAMEEIVVTAQRATIDLARTAQRQAENIVNVMSYEEIRKLPVVNSGDAVRMIPGVQLETDTGEGRFVNIRGLDSDLSSTTFGGVRLPATDVVTSPQAGSRAVSFDAIPAEMIGAVTVTKTNRPEQEAEALGGTIEISPKTVPTDGKPYFGDLRLGSGVEPLRRTHITDLAATFGGRFGAGNSGYGPFSAIGVLSYYEDRRGVDDLEGTYADNQAGGIPDKALAQWDQRYYRQHKKRHVYGAELGYAADEFQKWYLRYYDFGVVQDYNRNTLTFNTPANPTVNADGSYTETGVTALKTYRSTTETFDTRLLAAGGSNELDAVKLDYFIAHTLGSYERPYNYIPVWTNAAPSTITYNNTANASFPSFAVTGGANPYDPSGYTLSCTNSLSGATQACFSNSAQSNTTRDWSGKFNAAIATHWTGYATEELKFGIGARVRKFAQGANIYSATSVPAIALSQAVFGSPVTYYDGHYAMGPLIGTEAISNAFASGVGFTHDPVADAGAAALLTYNVDEDVYAAYGQYQFGFGKLGIFTGLRVESTRERFNAFAVDQNNNQQPIASQHSYSDFLPSLQTRYEVTPSLVARAIYSSTIGRPGYNQLSPGLNINLLQNSASQGNPDIKPTHSHNIDLSIEDYLPRAGIVSLGFFYKQLQDYIVPRATKRTFPNDGIFAALTGPVNVSTFENGPAARVLGYEFNFERRFFELPGVWSGLGAAFNWTGVNSRIQIHPGIDSTLPSTAKNTGNATLFYERAHVLEIRLGANYISRSLFAIFNTPATDVYSEARTSLDFGSKYFLSDVCSVYLDVKNLTDTPLTYTEGQSSRPIQRETYRQTVQIGFNATF